MKAIQVREFGDPEVLQLREIADPTPSEKQLKIDVKAVGVNPVDTYIRSGIYPMRPSLPYTPGLDAAGIVSEVGPAVTSCKVGDHVYVFGSLTGCYAEQLVCTEQQAYHLPQGVDFKVGASLGVPYSTAYFALYYRAHAMPGETVLIHGASGAVGLAAIQIAKSHGLHVIGTAGTRQGLDLIMAQGASAALNHNQEDYLDAIPELTGGEGVNIVLEMLANVNLAKDLQILARYGRVVIIGNRGSIEINPRDTMGKNASILGMAIFNATANEMKQMHAGIQAGVADGRFKPLIRMELPLGEAPQAHVKVMEAGGNGKIILVP